MPKLRKQTFETAIIERYQRRESSVEEDLIEMYLADVSVRRVEDITEALWGSRVSPGTVSNLDEWLHQDDNECTYEGKVCCCRTPIEARVEGKEIWREKFVN